MGWIYPAMANARGIWIEYIGGARGACQFLSRAIPSEASMPETSCGLGYYQICSPSGHLQTRRQSHRWFRFPQAATIHGRRP